MLGKLIFNYGTVCSGKTCYLLNVCFNYEKVGWKVCTVKPALDTRSELIETRAHVPPRKADIVIKSNESFFNYTSILNSCDVVLVDECQFLTEDQVDELRNLSVDRNIDILCFGLRTDFTTHLFPASKRLFEIADELTEIKTICSVCGKHASFNKKLSNNSDLIDCGWDTFTQVCYEHFKES